MALSNRRFVPVAMILTLGLASACRREPPSCIDCGPCGLVGGTIGENALTFRGAAVDASKQAVIQVSVATKDMCRGHPKELLLVWDGQGVTVEPPSYTQPATPVPVDQASGRYIFSDRDLSIAAQPETAPSGEPGFNLAFTSGDHTVRFSCWREREDVVCRRT